MSRCRFPFDRLLFPWLYMYGVTVCVRLLVLLGALTVAVVGVVAMGVY